MKEGILRVFQITIDHEVAATLYGFEYANQLTYFQSGFDPRWEKLSAGLVLMGKCIQYAYEHGLDHFDFMRGSDGYKFKWTNTSRKIDSINIALTTVAATSSGPCILGFTM